jgi:uncharacterized protein (DUF58 family)
MPDHISLQLRLKLPALWLLLLFGAALLLPDRVWTTLIVGLGGLFLVAYLWAREIAHGLRATRELRFGWVGVGDRLVEEFILRHTGRVPALWVEVEDDANVPGYSAALVRSASSSFVRWQKEAICTRRGQFHLGPWRLVSGDPFGIFRVTIHYPISEDIIIHPPIHIGLPVPLPAGQSSGRVRARQRAWQATINAGGVRAYQPRDPYRFIHWPSSAHAGELQVRQFDLDAAGDIWILVDMEARSQLGEGRDGTAEQAIIIAAALAARGLEQHRAVGLACYGSRPQVIPPGRGQKQQWRILRGLALTQADGEASLASAIRDLSQLVRRHTAVIIITPNAEPDWLPAGVSLAQMGVRSTVVLLDRPSFGGAGNSPGQREAIEALFAHCHVVVKDDIGKPAFETEKRGYWEFKVTPSGRAIPVRTPTSGRA